MADSAVKPSLQKHEKELKVLEGRLDQMQETMARSFEQSSTQFKKMGVQISQLNQKLQTTSKEIAQRVMEALEAIRHSKKVKPIENEVITFNSNSIESNTSSDLPPPSSPTPVLLLPLQFSTATNLFPITSISASVINPAARPSVSNFISHSVYTTPHTHPPPMIAQFESVIRPMDMSESIPNNPRIPSQVASMGVRPPYSEPTSLHNPANHNNPYTHSIQLLPNTQNPSVASLPELKVKPIPVTLASPLPPNSSSSHDQLSGVLAKQDYSVPFSGSDPCGFIQGYEEFFKMNPMHEVDMIQYVMQDLEGKALEWYYQYVEGKYLDIWTPDCWEDFVIELYGRFECKQHVFVERTETNRNQLQQDGDSFAFETEKLEGAIEIPKVVSHEGKGPRTVSQEKIEEFTDQKELLRPTALAAECTFESDDSNPELDESSSKFLTMCPKYQSSKEIDQLRSDEYAHLFDSMPKDLLPAMMGTLMEALNCGQECLDRLAIALGGNIIVPAPSEQLPVYLAAPEWQKHHTAVIALTQIAEGCSKVMIKDREQVVNMILNSFQDPHARVRWAAINTIGQLTTDLGPDLQVQYHQRAMPALAAARDDFQNPRVPAHTTLVVLNFSENFTPDILTPYLDGIVSKLLVLLHNGKQMVQGGTFTALASVADSSQEHFHKYYDAVIPYLKAILVNANDKSNHMLRAKSIECISLVGMAVGRNKFRGDAKQVMETLMSLQGSQIGSDDKRIGIKTSILEEKAIACNMLCCYADEMKKGFYPRIDQDIPTLVPFIKFYFHKEVRKADVSILTELSRSAKLAVEKGLAQGRNESYIKQLTDYIIPALGGALRKEPDTEICASILDALNECVQISGPILASILVLSYIVKITPVFPLYPSDSIDDLPRLTGFKGDEFGENGEVISGIRAGTHLPAFSGAYISAHGTSATKCTPALSHRRLMLQATDDLPLTFGFTGKGNTAKPKGLHEIIRAGAMGRKLHEDWGITPAPVWKLDNNAVLDPNTFQQKWCPLPISMSPDIFVSSRGVEALANPQALLRHMQGLSIHCITSSGQSTNFKFFFFTQIAESSNFLRINNQLVIMVLVQWCNTPFP